MLTHLISLKNVLSLMTGWAGVSSFPTIHYDKVQGRDGHRLIQEEVWAGIRKTRTIRMVSAACSSREHELGWRVCWSRSSCGLISGGKNPGKDGWPRWKPQAEVRWSDNILCILQVFGVLTPSTSWAAPQALIGTTSTMTWCWRHNNKNSKNLAWGGPNIKEGRPNTRMW